MSNVLEGPNPDQMKVGEMYRVVEDGKTKTGETLLAMEKVEDKKEFRSREVKIVTITDQKQAGLFAAAVNAEQCMSFAIHRDNNGKVESVDVLLECENEGLYELLEMLKEYWQQK